MLAVKEGYRNRGLGAQLKLEQRREALSRGIRHMEWTFDPLEIKNAFLNIHKLGAIVLPLSGEFLWCILISTAGWAADGSLAGGVGAGFAQGEAILDGKGRRHDQERFEGSYSGSGLHLPVEGLEAAGNEPSPFSWRTAASFNRHFPRGWPYLASPGCGRKWSLRTGSPPRRSSVLQIL
jgi:hypothetical protein